MKAKVSLGGSCHWCTEAIFQSLIGVEQVDQGWVASTNEHNSFSEAVIIHYNEELISLDTIIEVHLHTHSCTANHSFREKYRSAIYYESELQKSKVVAIIDALQKDFDQPIITQVLPFQSFKLNNEEQLNYYKKNPEKPFCQNIINPKLAKIKALFSEKVEINLLEY